jgi:hypothetical protein
MRNREVHRMIILDRKQRLAGLISVGDIAKIHGEEKVVAHTVGEIAKAA